MTLNSETKQERPSNMATEPCGRQWLVSSSLLEVIDVLFGKQSMGTSLAVQWLGVRASTARGTGSLPGRGTKIPQDVWRGRKKEKEKENRV